MNRPPRALALVTGVVILAGVFLPVAPGCRAIQHARAERMASQLDKPKTLTKADRVTQGNEAVTKGQALRSQGDLEAALKEFERAIAVNPAMTVAYIGAGEIHRTQGNLPEAERLYGRAAQLEPRNFDAQYGHGLVLQLMNRIADAIRAYLRALEIRPGDFEANLNIATAYLQVGDPQLGQLYAQRAVAVKPDSGEARVNLGAIYAALDKHEQAVIEYEQAAELMELSPRLLLNLADSLGHTRRYDQMVATLDQLIRIEPSAIAYERMGSGFFRLKKYEAAERAFREALELDPDHYPALNGVAVCELNTWLWSGQRETAALQDAVGALRRSLQLEPRQPQIVELLRRYGNGAVRAEALTRDG
ncbi:MAG: tetratricopeptide repeat protein [Phycisphaerales bacterium]